MAEILDVLPTKPDYAEIITWVSALSFLIACMIACIAENSRTNSLQNDGPESHYIGNLWLEQNSDAQPMLYASQHNAPHNAWRPLVTSFIAAFKAGLPSSAMRPPGDTPIGAFWYKMILTTSVCPIERTNQYTAKPNGFLSSSNSASWAIVMPDSLIGWSVVLYSDGTPISTAPLRPGLNSGTADGVKPGWQRMHVLDGNGNLTLVAAGGRCVSAGCPDCIYNMNPQVIGLGSPRDDPGLYPVTFCKS